MEPILYILMRTDLPSLNPGKKMAHAAHAANRFDYDVKRSEGVRWKNLATQWRKNSSQGFGTTIVLQGGSKQEMLETCRAMNDMIQEECMSGEIVDPTYPYSVNKEIASLIPCSIDTFDRFYSDDGMVHLCRKETTCWYVFGEKDHLSPFLGEMKLHP